MEIPQNLKDLYKHWEKHTQPIAVPLVEYNFSQELLSEISSFIIKRMHMWEKKENLKSPPYSDDPILNEYRFCNIYRELDRQTIKIHTILNPLKDDFNLWLLNLAYLRFVCNPETVLKTGLLSFNTRENMKVMESLKSLPSPKYGTAYLFPISVIQRSKTPTREEFFCKYIPKEITKVAEEIGSFDQTSVVEALDRILPIFGFNFRFHWTEILIDIAYQFPHFLNLYKEFPIGPGAIPTMQRLSEMEPEKTCLALLTYPPIDFPYLEFEGKCVGLSTENWEGIGCEFRKYTNLLEGKGRKRNYRPYETSTKH